MKIWSSTILRELDKLFRWDRLCDMIERSQIPTKWTLSWDKRPHHIYCIIIMSSIQYICYYWMQWGQQKKRDCEMTVLTSKHDWPLVWDWECCSHREYICCVSDSATACLTACCLVAVAHQHTPIAQWAQKSEISGRATLPQCFIGRKNTTTYLQAKLLQNFLMHDFLYHSCCGPLGHKELWRAACVWLRR